MKNNKKLIIIKISGASLKGEKDIIDINFLNELALQIKEIYKSFRVAIVLGGGNIWRGNIASEIKMERYKADQMGMLATVMNSLALQSALKNIDIKANIFSTIEMEKIADNYVIRHLKDSLERDEVAILSCGTGRPYFTTDTGIAVSAAELQASYILMGKNNVDGVYDSDPNKNPNAKFFKHLTYSKAINDELKVMDSTAAAICKLTNIKTIVFKINEPNGIVNALNLKSRFTLISEDESDLDNLDFLIANNFYEVQNDKEKIFNDYTDEEVEKFLEEETPVFSKISDEEIMAIEKFLKDGSEHHNVQEKDSNIENEVVDFATEFFSWEKSKTEDLQELEEKTINDLFEEQNSNLETNKNLEDLLNELNNANDGVVNMINEIETLSNDLNSKNIDQFESESNNLIEQLQNSSSIVDNHINQSEEEINHLNQGFEQEQELVKLSDNDFLYEDFVVNDTEINDDVSIDDDLLNKKILDGDFLENINFYIEEVENIKNNIIKENIEKTDEIKKQIEKKNFE